MARQIVIRGVPDSDHKYFLDQIRANLAAYGVGVATVEDDPNDTPPTLASGSPVPEEDLPHPETAEPTVEPAPAEEPAQP